MKKNTTFGSAKSRVLSMDKLNLHDKFTKENFLNLCSLRWSEWGRWRRFFVIAGAIAAIVVSAPSFVMILPCVTVFYLISCTIKNATEIVANWKWGPIFPKKRIKRDEMLNEIEEEKAVGNVLEIERPVKKIDQLKVEKIEDHFLESLESINGEEEITTEEITEEEVVETSDNEEEDIEDEFELPASNDEDTSFEELDLEKEESKDEQEDNDEAGEVIGEAVLLDEEALQTSKDTREESPK